LDTLDAVIRSEAEEREALEEPRMLAKIKVYSTLGHPALKECPCGPASVYPASAR
jgi:hypothetical protein